MDPVEISNLMTQNGFFYEVTIAPVWEMDRNLFAKELPRAMKVLITHPRDITRVTEDIVTRLRPDQQQKMKNAVYKLESRKGDYYHGDRGMTI